MLIPFFGTCPCCNKKLSFVNRLSIKENILCEGCNNSLSRWPYKKYIDIFYTSLFFYFIIWRQDYFCRLLGIADDRIFEIFGVALLSILYIVSGCIFGFSRSKSELN